MNVDEPSRQRGQRLGAKSTNILFASAQSDLIKFPTLRQIMLLN